MKVQIERKTPWLGPVIRRVAINRASDDVWVLSIDTTDAKYIDFDSEYNPDEEFDYNPDVEHYLSISVYNTEDLPDPEMFWTKVKLIAEDKKEQDMLLMTAPASVGRKNGIDLIFVDPRVRTDDSLFVELAGPMEATA